LFPISYRPAHFGIIHLIAMVAVEIEIPYYIKETEMSQHNNIGSSSVTSNKGGGPSWSTPIRMIAYSPWTQKRQPPGIQSNFSDPQFPLATAQ
jgi:hypothetical protein